MSAPKKRPAITGETTIAELAAIMRDHRVIDVHASWSGSDRWWVELDDLGPDWHGASLHEAIDEALRVMRMAQADELDLTPEEAAAHHARQAQVPELLDPDPEQRAFAQAITEGLRHVFYDTGWPRDVDRDDDGRAEVDLYETLPGPPCDPPSLRYLYTIIGEGF